MKISIEGNIGCGKSSLLTTISKNIRIPVFLEPVDTEWKQGLDYFYTDHARWGFTFNMNVLNTYSRWKNNDYTAVYERSPVSCKHVFTQLQKDSAKLTDYEYRLFNEIYDKIAWVPDVMIYVKTDPKVCFQRMQDRGRECESTVSLDYLQGVHDKHEAMFQHINTRAYIVDGNQDKTTVYNDVYMIINAINAL